MPSRPSIWIQFLVGARLAWSHLQQTPLYWLLLGLLAAGGLALGLRERWTHFFAPLGVAMFLTLPTSYWGWHAAVAGSAPAAREPLVSRCADEWVINLSRVVVNGLAGGFLSLVFSLASLLPTVAEAPVWQKGLLWTPHVMLAHALSAAIGTTAGLLSARRTAFGLICTGGLWFLVVRFAERMGTTSPDPLLRVLRWDMLLQDAWAEPLYTPLAVGFIAATVVFTLVGVAGFALLERRRVPVPRVAPNRIAVWVGTAAAGISAFMLLTWNVRAREAVLTTAPPHLGPAVLEWNPDNATLGVTHASGSRLIRGPVGPSAVALSGQRFSPYVGSMGVVVPVQLLTGPGPYNLHTNLPDGWSLLGCSRTTAGPTGGIKCEGERAESDWLVLLHTGRVHAAASPLRAADPARAEAQQLFRATLDAGFQAIGRPEPEVLFFSTGSVRWLSPMLLAGPSLRGGDPAVTTRQAAHDVAVALTLHLVDQRSGEVEPELLPLLATIDRLVFELGPIPVDPLERQRREGAAVNQSRIRYKPLPRHDQPLFQEWWIRVDEALITGQVSASALWQALATIQDADDARKWPETAQLLGI